VQEGGAGGESRHKMCGRQLQQEIESHTAQQEESFRQNEGGENRNAAEHANPFCIR